MNNRKARMLLGTRINLHGWVIFRISNRKRAAYIYRRSGVLDDMAFCLVRRRSAAQNRWKNHCYRADGDCVVESKGAQS